MVETKNPYRSNSKRHVIAQHLIDGASIGRTYHVLKDKLGTEPLIFSENTGTGSRRPLPMHAQRRALYRTIVRTWQEMTGDENPKPDNDTKLPGDGKPAPTPVPSSKPESPAEKLLKWVRSYRRFCERRAQGGMALDSISMRPIVYGKRALAVGIPPEAMVHAMCMHWPEDARREAAREAGVPAFDPYKFGKPIPGKHRALPYVIKLAEARIPIALIGPAGWGKSHLLMELAEVLSVPYGNVPMTAGATPSWLLGSWTLDGFKSRKHLDMYGSTGGVFGYEEMDSADPNMLLVVNNALANGYLDNPVNGETYTMHGDFIAACTMNTFGLGANRDYTGRERLDAATTDRWRMGRVFIHADETLEESILHG